jgi:hypothetical protein
MAELCDRELLPVMRWPKPRSALIELDGVTFDPEPMTELVPNCRRHSRLTELGQELRHVRPLQFREWHWMLAHQQWSCRGLTTCASAAGDRARARTNLRAAASSRDAAPRRSRGHLRPVGCMRGLGATPTRSGPWLGRASAWASLIANDPCQRAKRLVYGTGGRKDLGNIGLKDHNVAASQPTCVGVATSLAEVVLRKDVVWIYPGAALSGLLHSGGARDESRSGR